MTGEESGSGRRAGWSHMVIGQANAFGVQTIQIWRLQDRVAQTGKVSIALIVGQNEDYIRSCVRHVLYSNP